MKKLWKRGVTALVALLIFVVPAFAELYPEGNPLSAPVRWSIEVVPHHITVQIEGTPVQIAFQHYGYEIEQACMGGNCAPVRATDDGWILFTHYSNGIPFVYKTRAVPNMYRVGSEWKWIYRSTKK